MTESVSVVCVEKWTTERWWCAKINKKWVESVIYAHLFLVVGALCFLPLAEFPRSRLNRPSNVLTGHVQIHLGFTNN